MANFLQNLRAQGVFGGGKPFGMPNMDSGINLDEISAIINRVYPTIERENQKDRDFQERMFRLEQEGNLGKIARQMQQPVETKQPNVVFRPSITEYQTGLLGLREKELEQKGGLGQQKLEQTGADVATRQRRLELAEKIAEGRATDAEKHEFGIREIQERGKSQKEIQEMRGEQGIEQIGATGEEARKTEGTRQVGREVLAEKKGWTLSNITDPADPNKQIAVRINNDTGDVQRVRLEEKQVGPIAKPGAATKLTQPQDLQYIQDKTQETLSALDEILDVKGKLKPEMRTAVGKSRMAGLQYIPGSQTRTAEATIKRLKDRVTLDLLQEMKSRSKTGATGFGQLNLKELGVLESAASKIDPALSEDALEAELVRIKEKLRKVLLPEDGFTPTVVPEGKKPTASELIRKYGGG